MPRSAKLSFLFLALVPACDTSIVVVTYLDFPDLDPFIAHTSCHFEPWQNSAGCGGHTNGTMLPL